MANTNPPAGNTSTSGGNVPTPGPTPFNLIYAAPNDKDTPFNMLNNANFEPEVTVEHYEFYSQVKFGSSLPRQRSFAERQGARLGMVYASFVKPASRNVPDPYGATSFFPARKRHIGRGIYRIENGHHVAYFFENDDLGFDNREVDGLGAFLINQEGGEPNDDPVVVNIGRDFSGQHPRAKREALMVPAGGYLQTPNRRDMSMKLERIHTSCKIMKLGSVQKVKCTWCRPSKGYPEGRECKKLEGVLKCLWCTHGNKVCSLPGEKDVYDEGDGDDGNGGDDDGKSGKKFIRRRKSLRTPKLTAKVVNMTGGRTPVDRVDEKRSSTSRPGNRTGFQIANPWDYDDDDCAVHRDDSVLIHPNKSWIFSDDSSSILANEEMVNMLRETTTMFEGPNPKYQDIRSLFGAIISSASPELAAIKGQALTPKSTNQIVQFPTPQQVKNARTRSRSRASKKRGRRAKLQTDGAYDSSPGDSGLDDSLCPLGMIDNSIRQSAIGEVG